MTASGPVHTDIDMPVEIYWCAHCKIPILHKANESDKAHCLLCHEPIQYMCADLRPVFPQERLLLELMWKLEPNSLADKSIWASNSRIYIDGKAKSVTMALYKKQDVVKLREELEKYQPVNRKEPFREYIEKFVKANRKHLSAIVEEAHNFIRSEAGKYPQENIRPPCLYCLDCLNVWLKMSGHCLPFCQPPAIVLCRSF